MNNAFERFLVSDHTLNGYVLVIFKDKQNRIVLLQRSQKASFAPGKYCIPGGRVEKGETFRDAAVRESFEELGVVIHHDDLKFVHTFYRNSGKEELVVIVFEALKWQGDVYNKEPEKHTDLLWSDIDQLPANIVPAHRNVLGLIESGVLYSDQSNAA